MIRRLNKHSDLKDLIKSCPSGVIDDIYAIEYYIQGYNTVIQANFTKKETMLEVIIPSTDLETLPNGILMRRAYYKVLDTSYPDGYYNLEFEDNMNVWIGENESEEPVIPDYVTEEELAETLDGYVTEEELAETLEGYVTDQEFNGAVNGLGSRINAVADGLSGCVTDQNFNAFVNLTENRILETNAHLQSVDDRVTALEQNPGGVSQEQFAAHVQANNASFEIVQLETRDQSQRISDLENAGFATQQDLADVRSMFGEDIQALQEQIDALDASIDILRDATDNLDQRVTTLEQGGVGGGSWGNITGDITDQEDLMDVFGEQEGWIHDAEDRIAALEDGTTVPTGTATESWVQQQGYITTSDLSGYATETWVQNQGYLTQHQDLTGYATQSWVQNQGYLTQHQDLTGYATESWVSSQQFATQSWVQNQGYLTQHQDLTGYATQSWVGQQGYLTSVPSTYATKLYVDTAIADAIFGSELPVPTVYWGDIQGTVTDQSDLMYEFDKDRNRLSDLEDGTVVPTGIATESWVSSQQFATQSWVSSQGYLTSHQDLTGYATESWVSSQQFATQYWVQAQDASLEIRVLGWLSSYATQSWTSSNFLATSLVWTGSQAAWEQLTSAQQALYTIALVTE